MRTVERNTQKFALIEFEFAVQKLKDSLSLASIAYQYEKSFKSSYYYANSKQICK